MLAAVLGAASALGFWRQRSDGRIRAVPEGGERAGGLGVSESTDAAKGADVASITDAAFSGESEVDAQATDRDGSGGASELLDVAGERATVSRADTLTAREIGGPLGDRVTLVQFSSAFCQPCRSTRAVLADVAATVPGVRHVEIDAESQLDLVRRLDITRTPTVLILDGHGRIRRRAIGAPRRPHVLAAIGELI